ncbi:gluzincin family metallopeptidase [Paracoccus zhejiangensis]|uniref:Peptidase M4 n=1 Tax=Paracoccus zhejiangensis TaxID=1077935 RepID=A0A2H5EYN8_9RHOB|nr:hypothetical protein [Paracoccus zhejiangensis]AUH64415.1 hypothetical protein CX676_09785 [Paracoccus zhejiangensis]
MGDLPRCTVSAFIGREAGVAAACYLLKGNIPAALRKGQVYTVDSAIRISEGAFSEISIPHEPLRPGPEGKLFAVSATDFETGLDRSFPDLDRSRGGEFGFDQGDFETHCRNVYFSAMSVYELFRRALGRPVAWAFWSEDKHPPLRLRPFAQRALNAYYDRDRAEIGFGFDRASPDSARADARLLRFTALSSDVVAHEVTHALLDGLRPDYDLPVHPDVFAFHEAVADIVALLSRFTRQNYLAYVLADFRKRGLKYDFMTSLAPELGRLVRKSGLRTLTVEPNDYDAGLAPFDTPRYVTAELAAHERGGLLSSAVFEAFLQALMRRIKPLVDLVAPQGNGVADRYLIEQIQHIAATTAGHFLEICIRALDYCPPASIRFADYLRALITADQILVADDRYGYRESLIEAFRNRGIYPEDIDVVSEAELRWNAPSIPVSRIPGLALSELRFDISPVLPRSADEVRRQAQALALAIDDDPRLAREMGLADPGEVKGGDVSPPVVTSIRPTLRVGREGYVDFSIIAEVTQDRLVTIDGGTVRLRGGATLILGPQGDPQMIVRQRIDNEARIKAETDHLQQAIAGRQLVLQDGRYVVAQDYRHAMCGSH